MGKHAVLGEAARVGRLAFVTGVVALISWTLVAPARAAAEGQGPSAAGRGATITVAIDGLSGTVRAAGTVADALRAVGVSRGATDRLSSPTDAPVRFGQRISLDRGVPVTLVDAGRVVAERSPRGTVADLLAAAGVEMGPLDRVEPALESTLVAGGVVRVTRIAVREETVREAVAFPVRTISDPTLDRSRQVVVTAGTAGEAINTYRVRAVDGVDASRTLVSSTQVAAPSEEVRRVGTRLPSAPADVEAIIRAAAAAQDADADQLLRVAWCESRYNPYAMNPSGASGLFQFMPGTWAANSARAGFAGASVFDPVAAANVAAWMFARGNAGQWACT